jgi:alcohol dehydrogenase class IV
MFAFRNTKNLIFELGSASSRLGELFQKELQCSSILLITDKGVRSAGLIDGAVNDMRAHGLEVEIFDRVEADPPEAVIEQAVAFAAACNCDGVLGLGGGSSMDVAKVVAFLRGTTSQSLSELYGVEMCRGSRLPLIQVPTTAGTGSEVTPISIVTTGTNTKMGIVSHQLYPDVAVLDGTLTLSVPQNVTAATGIDAMVHAIEARTSKFKKNPMSDVLAHEALRLLSTNLRIVCADGNNGEARADMLLGSCLAGMAFGNSPVAAVHALAYPLGSHFKVAHGLSNSLVLPHVLRFNASDNAAAEEYSEIAKICFPPKTLPLIRSSWPTHLHGAEALAEGFSTLAEELEIPTRLSEVGVTEEDLDMLAVEALKQQRLLPNNPVEVKLDDARELYAKAL